MEDSKDRTPQEEVPAPENEEEKTFDPWAEEPAEEDEVAEEPSGDEPLPVTEALDAENAAEEEPLPVEEPAVEPIEATAEDSPLPVTESIDEPPVAKDSRPSTDSSITRLLLLVAGMMVLIFIGIFYFMSLTPESPEAAAPSPTKVAGPAPKVVSEGQKIKIPISPPEEPVTQQAVEKPPVAAVEPVSEAVPAIAEVKSAEPVAVVPESVAQKEEPAPAAEAPSTVVETVPAEEPILPVGDYSLLAGSYLVKGHLTEAQEKIARLGLPSKVRPQLLPVTMTRVKVGTFPIEEGRQRLDTLKAAIPEAFALAVGQDLTLYAGSFLLPSEAEAMLDLLRQQGIQGELENADLQMEGYSLSIGPFATRQDAEDAQRQTREVGLETTLFRRR